MLECQFLYTCSVCGDMEFNSLPELEQHMAEHDNQSVSEPNQTSDLVTSMIYIISVTFLISIFEL